MRKRVGPSQAQEDAFRMHRLSGLARIHVGPRATVARRGETYAVGLDGAEVAAGPYEHVVDAITAKQEAAR